MKLALVLLFLLSEFVYAENSKREKRAWGYFHPAWKATHEMSLPITATEMIGLAIDPERRTEEEFRVPELLLDRVVFWMRIYGQYSSWMKVLHDSQDPRIVYGYLDFTPLYNKKMGRVKREIVKQLIEKEVLRTLKAKLRSLESENKEDDAILLKIYLTQFDNGSETSGTKRAKRVRSQMGQRDIFALALHRSPKLLDSMEGIFKEKGLPGGLTRLPFVESSFNPDAKSKTGAVGIWQFMPYTARAYIDRNSKVRWQDSILQTHAAAEMLRHNRRALPDWGTTVTSYNSGVGRLYRLVKKHNVKNIELLLSSNQLRLGFAGKNFYSEFLAALLVESYKDAIFHESYKASDPSGVFTSIFPVLDTGCLASME